MTGQIEGDKPSRLKEERFPSLSLIARELQFSELNTQYLLQIGQFSTKQQNPLPSHQFDCQWLSCFSLRGTHSKGKRLNTKKSSTGLAPDVHTGVIRTWPFRARRNATVPKDTWWMHTHARESTQLRKNTSSSLRAPDKMLQCSKFLQHALPGHASMEIQDQGTELERNTEQCTAHITTRPVRRQHERAS